LFGVRVPQEVWYVSLLQNIQTVCGAHLASYSTSTGILSGGQSGQGVTSTTHLYPAPTIRTSGTIHSLCCMPTWHYQDKHPLRTRPKRRRRARYHKLMHTVKLLLILLKIKVDTDNCLFPFFLYGTTVQCGYSPP